MRELQEVNYSALRKIVNSAEPNHQKIIDELTKEATEALEDTKEEKMKVVENAKKVVSALKKAKFYPQFIDAKTAITKLNNYITYKYLEIMGIYKNPTTGYQPSKKDLNQPSLVDLPTEIQQKI